MRSFLLSAQSVVCLQKYNLSPYFMPIVPIFFI